jgi:hypothetical protein
MKRVFVISLGRLLFAVNATCLSFFLLRIKVIDVTEELSEVELTSLN